MQNLPKPIRLLAPLARPARRGPRGRSGCGTTERRHRARPHPLHQEVRRLPHAGAGGHHGDSRPEPRRRLRGGARSRRLRRDHGRRHRQGPDRLPAPRERQPGRLDARPHRRRHRTSTTSPPTSANTPASPAPRRRKSKAAPAPRSSPTTAAVAATRWPPPTRAASPAPTSTKSFPARSEAEIEESIVDPNAKIAQGYPAERHAAELRAKRSQPEELKELVKYLSENAGKENQAALSRGGRTAAPSSSEYVRDAFETASRSPPTATRR